MQQLAKRISSTDGELSRIRDMAEQLEACVLDDLRDLGARLESLETLTASNHSAKTKQPQAESIQQETQASQLPAQADAAQLQAFMEKRLRRVEMTMAGEPALWDAGMQT